MRLRQKFVFAFTGTLIFLIFLISVAALVVQERALNEEFRQHTESLSELIGFTMSDMSSADVKKTKLFLTSLMEKEKSLLYILARDPDEKITEIIGDFLRKGDPAKKVMEKAVPIKRGSIVIGFTRAGIGKRVWELRIQYAVITMLAVILVAIFSILVSSLFMRPFELLLSSLPDSVGMGLHRSARFSQASDNDEIEEISFNFRKIASDLHDSFIRIDQQNQEILQYNEHLEEIVAERVKEVNRVNSVLLRSNEVMLEELEMARRVQQGIIPANGHYPSREEFRIGIEYLSMERIGGDLVDVVRIGKNGYGFLVADVSGHGIPAALIATMSKVTFSDHSGWNQSPADVMEEVNEELLGLIGDLGYYLTAFYAILNLETGVLEFASAGHQPALLLRTGEAKVEKLVAAGSILGVFEKPHYACGRIILKPGDRFLLYTDGIVEARNPDGELFSVERLANSFEKSGHIDPQNWVENVVTDVDLYTENTPPEDDRAIMCVEFVKAAKTGALHG